MRNGSEQRIRTGIAGVVGVLGLLIGLAVVLGCVGVLGACLNVVSTR